MTFKKGMIQTPKMKLAGEYNWKVRNLMGSRIVLVSTLRNDLAWHDVANTIDLAITNALSALKDKYRNKGLKLK